MREIVKEIERSNRERIERIHTHCDWCRKPLDDVDRFLQYVKKMAGEFGCSICR